MCVCLPCLIGEDGELCREGELMEGNEGVLS